MPTYTLGQDKHMSTEDPNAWLTAGEAARIKGVTPQTITKACRAGRLPCRRANGTWLIRRADLDAWEPGKKSE